MSRTYTKPGAGEIGTSIDGVPKNFVFPYTTDDPQEQAFLEANGAEEVLPKPVAKRPAAPEDGGE